MASLYDPARYYKPYISDDSELESDSDSDGYISTESLLDTPGKREPILSEVYEETDVKSSGPGASGTEFKTSESKNTSLFMINSRDRDTRAYPQPTFFTLRLPRTFKNIKQINLSQLNLLNSFFNFSKDKGNTWMYVYELGRTLKDASGVDISNAVKIQIRNGTYTADDLVLELNNALNSTPLFADIALGDFINRFQATGDFTILFNTPGAVVFNSLTQTYDRNQTLNSIVARYFQVVQTVGTISYSYDQCLIAYYYPVMKEMIVESGSPTFSVVGQDIPEGFSSWYDYIVFAFQGLNDPYITNIVKDSGNQALFDQYRFERTFNNFLVNKYTCSYNSKQGRLIVTATSLNDSIVNDLTSQYNQILNSLVVSNGFSNVQDFNSQYNNVNNSNGALIELYNFIQNRFTSNFGVNFGTYTAEFYTDSNNEISIYNTNNKYGWNLTLTPQVSQNSISSFVNPPQCSNWWSNITVTDPILQASNYTFVSTLGVPDFIGDELFFNGAGEQVFGYTDISFSVIPTNYSRVVFNSRCRQNISIMTLPRYINERGPGTEMVYSMQSTIVPLLYSFDGSDGYIKTDISGNPLFNFYTVAQNMFASAPYMRAFDEWLTFMVPQSLAGIRVQQTDPNFGKKPPIGDIGLNSFRPYQFYQVHADKYLVDPNARFRITFYAETQGGNNFPVPIVITWYKDRAGFMADVEQDLVGNLSFENPRHYFQRTIYGTDLSSAQMIVTVNNSEDTYFMVHVLDRTTVPASIPLRVFCLLTDPYGEYTEATTLDRYTMPYAGLPPIADQFTPDSDVYKDPLRSIYASTIFQLGYDISGVSNNLLDYIVQGNNLLYDPANIETFKDSVSTGLRFQFNVNSAASPQPLPTISSSKWSLYFGSNGSNTIRDLYSLANNIYLSSLQVPKPLDDDLINHATLVNWYKAGNPNFREFYLSPYIAYSSSFFLEVGTNSFNIFQPAINPTTPLVTDMSTNITMSDSNGISGVSFFLPPNQVVQIDDITLKFAYTQPSVDRFGSNITRTRPPGSVGAFNAIFRNQSVNTYISSVSSYNSIGDSEWDDWYLPNRRNVKLAVFLTDNISGANMNDLSISSALCSMTLKKVTQVNNYQNQLGTLRTREPDWGTYYTYVFDHEKPGVQSNVLWDVKTPYYYGTQSNYWRSTIVPFDYAPVYTAGNTTYSNYFLTHPKIQKYTYLPRSVGIGTSVDDAVTNPGVVGGANYTEDIPNSYTAVPFYYDETSSDWKVGSFYALSFTQKPALPPISNVATAPFYGPPGIYAWTKNGSSNLTLHNGFGSNFSAFYFNAKINYDVLDVTYNPATDLEAFGGFTGISNEYQDTMLFFYNNGTPGDDFADISTTYTSNSFIETQWVWGQESNSRYYAFDDQGGYNYLSYIHDVPVRPTVDEYAIHVRAYDPIPSFNTGVRFIGKNYTDFGRPQLIEIAQEISSLSSYTYITDTQAASWMSNWVYNGSNLGEYNSTISTNNSYLEQTFISHEYADSLKLFDTSFKTSAIFGKSLSYNGLLLSFTGYEDCLTQYIALYSNIRNVISIYTNVLSTATADLNTYVVDRYSNILPQAVLNRNRITDPLPFQFLFKSKLTSPYDKMTDEWGLGYNLGFEKRDTSPPRTTIVSDTFIRIVQDYVYLRLNPEFNINTMGVSSKEDLSVTKDSVSEDQKYFSKIILNNFGSFCRTAVQLPKMFNPVLGKYDTISCQLVDRNGAQISSLDCEYDFVLEITEITNGPVENATLQGPGSDLEVYKGERKSTKMQSTGNSGVRARPRITTNANQYVLNLADQTNVVTKATGT